MPVLKSLDDLKKAREAALKKQDLKTSMGKTEIVVGMGTVGIAAGARETLKAILDYVEAHNLEDIIVRQTGNIGIDSFEPIVQVILPGLEPVVYGFVNAEVVQRIMAEHVVKGKIVKDHLVHS